MLVATVTGFDELEQTIKKTKSQKEILLVVLNQEVPLHNNYLELVARAQAIRRDVRCLDENIKNSNIYCVSFYHYTHDLMFRNERTMDHFRKN